MVRKISQRSQVSLGNFFRRGGGGQEFSQSSQVHKKGGQKGLKTLIRPYIFRKIFTKFPSLEKGGGSRFLTLFPSSQSSQPPQGGWGQQRLWIFPKFSHVRVLKASLTVCVCVIKKSLSCDINKSHRYLCSIYKQITDRYQIIRQLKQFIIWW